jgi:hypothetical protein
MTIAFDTKTELLLYEYKWLDNMTPASSLSQLRLFQYLGIKYIHDPRSRCETLKYLIDGLVHINEHDMYSVVTCIICNYGFNLILRDSDELTKVLHDLLNKYGTDGTAHHEDIRKRLFRFITYCEDKPTLNHLADVIYSDAAHAFSEYYDKGAFEENHQLLTSFAIFCGSTEIFKFILTKSGDTLLRTLRHGPNIVLSCEFTELVKSVFNELEVNVKSFVQHQDRFVYINCECVNSIELYPIDTWTVFAQPLSHINMYGRHNLLQHFFVKDADGTINVSAADQRVDELPDSLFETINGKYILRYEYE